jgi:hypothetical protein
MIIRKKEVIDNREINVTIHIPDEVKNIERKINGIYEILKPKNNSGTGVDNYV